MEPKFEEIRQALCLSRGGWQNMPRTEVEKGWQSLTEEQRRGYLERLRKLPAKDRKAFADELPKLPSEKQAPEPMPAGDEFAPQPKADDDTTDPNTHPPDSDPQADRTDG